ncbi:prolipoprotein diacylglyceryl transferase [Gulosibacter molinativorax]|uniref:Phosphatidylglycerol--prolipoprotein diacylglyceryl transferase n=1 Tax=Gulosibacter molinativorax TaxID=256821 RepID=A0ABT7C7G9_9MICO|nr:prolipoprotein diacylglyceryl transferase [Gulosibacter molinativorax]MDJ1371087.1 prolipoprotein diacylglyceryl transferase [Gulosibacter molinativorax]QUY61447.1 Prolipoprotein diacylglyceryl transferase [Gulosibacter molinativorax]
MTLAPASIPSPPIEWSSFTVGPFTFHVYALIIVVGMIVAMIWTNRRMVARGAEPWVVIDIVIPTVILGLLGARLYHVFTHPADYFYEGAEWWRVFAIWEGGNAIIGALIGGAIGAYFACRFKGIRFLSFADALAPGLLLAQAIGRLGNWFNHELFGWPTDLPWGLEILSTNPAVPEGLPAGTLFHPTFLYELLWNLLGVAVILILERMFRMRWGKTIAVYLIWYGLGRMAIESIRVDYSEVILGMRSNVFGALVMVVIGVVLFIVQTRKHKEPELSVYGDGHVWTETEAEDDKQKSVESKADADEDSTDEVPNDEESSDEDPKGDTPAGADDAPEQASATKATD